MAERASFACAASSYLRNVQRTWDPCTSAVLLGGVAAVLFSGGARVNWIMTFEQLRQANVSGTLELLELAATTKRKPFHFVSTISTTPLYSAEDGFLTLQQAAAGGGYGASKWLAELAVRAAKARGLPVTISRPSMVTGHSINGDHAAGDFTNRYLRTAVEIGCYIDDSAFRGKDPRVCQMDMTPVDFVAQAVVAIAERSGQAVGRTFHITNVGNSLSYQAVGQAIAAAGYATHGCTYRQFQRTLTTASDREGEKPSLAPLLTHFPAPPGTFAVFGWWASHGTKAFLAAAGVADPIVTADTVALYVRSNFLSVARCT